MVWRGIGLKKFECYCEFNIVSEMIFEIDHSFGFGGKMDG
jgi:hypothetical protein